MVLWATSRPPASLSLSLLLLLMLSWPLLLLLLVALASLEVGDVVVASADNGSVSYDF